jgi:hypothetical protein
MKHPLLATIFLLSILMPGKAEMDKHAKHLSPDTIFMNDGRKFHGLIIKNDATEVTLQQRMGEVEIPKAYIRRIDDEPDTDVFFADIANPGKLPPWRMIVEDLRSDDSIRSFRQIPATTIDNGYLKNIPYLSFKINERVEMNVYGNPEDPVCIEFGIYERGEKITQFKKIIRAYLAGILGSRDEVGALYSLDEKGGKTRVGKFTFQITPPDAPDAYGGWWISIFDAARLEKFRVPDEIYRKNTLPFDAVNHSSGVLRKDKIGTFDQFLSGTMKAWKGMIPGLRGFYRDNMGELNLDVPSILKKKPALPSPSQQ